MQYLGGKSRISNDISNIINNTLAKDQPFVDAFCGSCAIISKVKNNRIRIANDKHKYLIAMFQSLQKGWIPPENVSEEDYYFFKNNQEKFSNIAGFVGFQCSYAGKWWGGYARNSRGDNYALQGKNSLLKIADNIKDIMFTNFDYADINLPKESLIYCDIPYKNSTKYSNKEIGNFDYDKFYNWVRYNSTIGHKFLISEYEENIPPDFKIIWRKQSNKELRNSNNERKETIEVLITQ